MIQNSQYRAIPTDLQLNGPILSFVKTPSDTTLAVGQSAYFTGVATAQFPTQTPANPAVGFATGTIAYQWYSVTDGQLTEGTKYTGTATTELYINGVESPSDNGTQYYLSADYVAIGTSPNANNESFTSSRASLTVYPEIIINTHPSDVSVGAGGQATFTIDASLTDGSYGGLAYQWRIDGENLTDGTYESLSVAKQGVRGQIDDAVLLVPLNEDAVNTGNVNLRDYSNNTKTVTAGSLYGDAPVWQSTGFATGNFYNGAAYFNGSTSYINVAGSSDFNMADQPFTMEVWIKWSDQSWSSDWEVISSLGGGYYHDGGIWWSILRNASRGDSTTFYISGVAGYSPIATNVDVRADDDEWHHYAVTRTSRDDGHKVRMWMDGKLVGENTVNFVDVNFGGDDLGYIGLEHATFHRIGYYYPNCWMQDFRCYKGLEKYTQEFTPSRVSILGYTRNISTFNDSFPAALALPLWNRTGTINEVSLDDISQNDLTITSGETTLTWDTDVKKWYDGSAKFPNDDSATLSVEARGLGFGLEDFTIEAWCYFTKTGFADIFSTDDYSTYSTAFDNAVGGLFAFRKNSAEKLSFYCNPNFESSNVLTDGDTISQNTWVHCAVSRQDGVVRLFLQGNLQGTHDFSPGGAGTTPNHSGGKPRVGGVAGNSKPMGGYIQDLIVYKGVAKYTEDFIVPDRSIISEDKSYSKISGSQTTQLTITPDEEGSSKIDCLVTHPVASSKTSKKASLVVTEPKSIIKIEGYDGTSTATLLQKNLEDSEFTLTKSDLDSDDICFYAAEKDIEVEIDMYGGKGIGFDEEGGTNYNAGFRWTSGGDGGEGGFSRIQFTMKKNEEYILRGIKSNTALFLYRKASLIAVVGQGGNGGHYGKGGKGGGVNVAGESTVSSSGGTGGRGGFLIPEGELEENGIFGSRANPSTVYPEDFTTDGKTPGQTIKCSKGVYWRDQGKGACEDVGTVKFRLSDGTEVTNSAIIDRGFKAGYSINSTGGAAEGDGASGGHGATGGEGHNSAGGGGGSGYSDGSITIFNTQLGGSTGNARINMRLSAGDFFVDDKGRILILSNTDNRDPRTLTKTTSKVLRNTNTCIDDTRWQRFIDLARDGTQNYRLTATLNNSTTKIVNATDKNIHKMINGNALTLRNSLTGWVDSNYAYTLLALAWDETSNDGMSGYGGDYSILSWSPTSNHGHGYYGSSSNSFFTPTTYNHYSANWWILPPGVPDF